MARITDKQTIFKPLKNELLKVLNNELEKRGHKITNLNKAKIPDLMKFIDKFKFDYINEILELREEEKRENLRREMERIKWQREKERDLFIYNQILTELNENDLNEIKSYWIEAQEKIDNEYITNNKEKIKKARERQQEMIKNFNERLPGSTITTTEEDESKGLNVLNCNGIHIHFGDGDDYTKRNKDALEYQFKREMEFIIPKYYNNLINGTIIKKIKRKLDNYSDSEDDESETESESENRSTFL
jgi:hypothetical protein